MRGQHRLFGQDLGPRVGVAVFESIPVDDLTRRRFRPRAHHCDLSRDPTGRAGLPAVVLRPGDLPASWQASAYKPDPADAAQHAAFLKSVGARNTDADKVVEAHSSDFSLGDAGISSDATRYKSATDLAVDTATLRNPKALACYKTLANPSFLGLPAGSTIDSKAFRLTGREAAQPANAVGDLHDDTVVTVSGLHRLGLHPRSTPRGRG